MDNFPILATRSVDGLHMFADVHQKSELSWSKDAAKFHNSIPEKREHRAMQFSEDGTLFAYVNEVTGTHIMSVADNKNIFTIPLPKTSWLQFSPENNYICLQQPLYATQDGSKAPENVTIWSLSEQAKINEIYHTKSEWTGFLWCPSETWYARISADQRQVLFFEPAGGKKVMNRINSVDNAPIVAFSMGDGMKKNKVGEITGYEPLVSVFQPEHKGKAASVRVFRYPDFDQTQSIARKSFFKAEDARFYWSKSARGLICLASTDIDKTGQSYYGSTALYHASTKGKTAGEVSLIPIAKNGPCYDIAWQPNKEAFCVVYGFMPSNATVYSSPKLDVLYNFNEISKNTCLYSPGKTGLLALCGFGNLGGKIEVWKTGEQVKVCEFTSPDTTHMEWAADGIHLVAATTSPRLRTANRLDILHCTGERKFRLDSKTLWEVAFQPRPKLSEQECTLTVKEVRSAQKDTKARATEEQARKFITPARRRQMEAEKASKQGVPAGDKKSLENKQKALKKKMTAIKKCKKQLEEGVELNEDQLEKIANEASFQAQLDRLAEKLATM